MINASAILKLPSDKSAGALFQNPEFFFQRRRPWKAVAAVRKPRFMKLGQQAY
jgi:hypothetical protein